MRKLPKPKLLQLSSKADKILSNGMIFYFLLYFSTNSLSQLHIPATVPTICTNAGLPISVVGQEANMWCWAATIQMAANYLDPTLRLTQCQIATKRTKLNPMYRTLPTSQTACNCSKTSNCVFKITQNGNCLKYFQPLDALSSGDYRSNTDTITALLKSYGFKTAIIDTGANCLNKIKASLCANRPVIGLYFNRGSAGHVVLITGFENIPHSSESYLIINNPLYDNQANCRGCSHVIQTNSYGKNIFGQLKRDVGTYSAIVYMSVFK